MKNRLSSKLEYALVAVVLIAATTVWIYIVAHDGVSTLSTDAASYVLQARWLLDTFTGSNRLSAGVFFYNYPPGWSFLLLVTGLAWDLYWGHVLVVVLISSALLLQYALARRWVDAGPGSLVAVMLVVLAPGLWIHSLPLASENLFALLGLAAVYFVDRWDREIFSSAGKQLLLALVLAAMLFTRVATLAMCLALLVFMLYRAPALRKCLRAYLIVISVPVVSQLVWHSLRPIPAGSFIATQFAGVEFFLQLSMHDVVRLIGTNLYSLFDAWIRYFTLFNFGIGTISWWLIAGLGVASVLGWFVRLKALKIDALYVLFYLGIYILWPYPGEMKRFMHPIVPLVAIYVVVGTRFLMSASETAYRKWFLVSYSLSVMLVMLISQLHAFDRHVIASRAEHPYAWVRELYEIPSAYMAHQRAINFTGVMQDMKNVARITDQSQRIASVRPDFLSLLANRSAVDLPGIRDPETLYCGLIGKNVDYVLVTGLTSHTNATGTQMRGVLSNYSETVYRRTTADGKEVSWLMKLDKSSICR